MEASRSLVSTSVTMEVWRHGLSGQRPTDLRGHSPEKTLIIIVVYCNQVPTSEGFTSMDSTNDG